MIRHEIYDTLSPPLGDKIMTLRERAIQEGMHKGRQEGRLEGQKEGKYNIARKMLECGADLSFVVGVTGLSESEIEQQLNPIS